MKRIMIILLSMLLLTGCRANADKPIVSNQNITPDLMTTSDNDLYFYN